MAGHTAPTVTEWTKISVVTAHLLCFIQSGNPARGTVWATFRVGLSSATKPLWKSPQGNTQAVFSRRLQTQTN